MVVTGKGRRSREWAMRVNQAYKELQKEQREWRRNRALLLGIPPTGTTDWASVNLAWAAMETLIGVCFQKTSEVIVRETKAEAQNAARLLTTATFEDLDTMRERFSVRLGMLDVFWAGRGWIMEKMVGDLTSGTVRWTEDQKEVEAAYPRIVNKRMVSYRVHPNGVLVDSYATQADCSDAAWLSFDFYPTIKELKESNKFTISDEMLKALPKLKVAPTMDSPYGQQNHPSVIETGTNDDDYCKVRMREIWSREHKKKFYIPALCDEIVGEEEWPIPLYYNGQLRFPAVPLFFNEHPDKNFPIPELSPAAPQIEQYQILFRTVIRDVITRWRKYLVHGGALQKGHISRITTGPAHAVVSIDPKFVGDPMKLDLNKLLVPIPDTPVKQDVVAVMGMVKQVVHEIFGAGDFASAGFRSTRSATEAASLTDFLKVRMTNRTENIDAFFKERAINHVLLLQQILDEPRVAQLTDAKGVQSFVAFDKSMIQGDFTFHVVAGSSQSRNTEVARQEALAFFQQTLPIVSQSGGDIRPLIEWIAPHYRMPQHIVDSLFSGHKQALQQLALIMAAVHMGARIPGPQLIEAISLAVNTGLSSADMQAIMQQAMSATKAPALTAGAGGQPGGLPGSNGGPGTSGAPGPPA